MRFVQSAGRTVADNLGHGSAAIRKGRFAYEWALGSISSTRGIPWNINGVEYRIDPQHRQRLGHDHDSVATAFLASRIQPGALTFNVGANVGVHVLQLAHFSRPTGRVVAFEPNPVARSVLDRHVRMNRLAARVAVEPYALGPDCGEAILYLSGADGMARLDQANPLLRNVTTISVPIVTLDKYCERHHLVPDCVVMDVEGFEIGALQGAARLVQEHRSLILLVELHPNMWPSCGESNESFEALMRQLGLEPVPLVEGPGPFLDHRMVWLRPQRP